MADEQNSINILTEKCREIGWDTEVERKLNVTLEGRTVFEVFPRDHEVVLCPVGFSTINSPRYGQMQKFFREQGYRMCIAQYSPID